MPPCEKPRASRTRDRVDERLVRQGLKSDVSLLRRASGVTSRGAERDEQRENAERCAPRERKNERDRFHEGNDGAH